jgi:hypothetical protein
MEGDMFMDMGEPKVLVTRPRYDELIEAEKKLVALENAGVNNWSGYSYAQEMMREEEEDD